MKMKAGSGQDRTLLLGRLLKLTEHKTVKIPEATLAVIAQILVVAIDQAVGDQVGAKAQSGRYHVLVDVVADHQALLRMDAADRTDLLIIIEVRLAGGGIVIGGDILKIIDIQSCPFDAGVGSGFRKDRIGRHDQADAATFEIVDALSRKRLHTGFGTSRDKLAPVEFVDLPGKDAHIPSAGMVHGAPEHVLVQTVAVVLRHARNACPDGVHQRFGVKLRDRHHLLAEHGDVQLHKFSHIHRQQGAVEIKQHIFIQRVSPFPII